MSKKRWLAWLAFVTATVWIAISLHQPSPIGIFHNNELSFVCPSSITLVNNNAFEWGGVVIDTLATRQDRFILVVSLRDFFVGWPTLTPCQQSPEYALSRMEFVWIPPDITVLPLPRDVVCLSCSRTQGLLANQWQYWMANYVSVCWFVQSVDSCQRRLRQSSAYRDLRAALFVSTNSVGGR